MCLEVEAGGQVRTGWISPEAADVTRAGECGIVPGKLKSTANGTEQGFLFLEKVVLLAQCELRVLLPGWIVGPPRRCQCEANFIGI